MKSLENKVAIITGAGSGIGKAGAVLFAREGAKVVVSDIDKKNGEGAVEEIIRDGGDAHFIAADSSRADDNARLVEETVKKYGRLDVAVNNAGIGGPLGATGDYPVDGWQ